MQTVLHSCLSTELMQQGASQTACTVPTLLTPWSNTTIETLSIDRDIDPALTGTTALFAACERGNHDCVELLVAAESEQPAEIESSADRPRKSDGCTPLFISACNGHHR